jgi:hypothetical protein
VTAEIIKAHLDAIEGQLELTKVQILALRHALAPLFAPTARPSLPDRCTGIARCALQDEDARISKASFAEPNAWKCVGCGHREAMTTA